mmetsp:Transcript_18938/g.44060  ORF Transcript_18938/g.44060 Transcript_18938/m.44060 type:complete len:218 (-) Transcript_18938:1287-1940(-)
MERCKATKQKLHTRCQRCLKVRKHLQRWPKDEIACKDEAQQDVANQNHEKEDGSDRMGHGMYEHPNRWEDVIQVVHKLKEEEEQVVCRYCQPNSVRVNLRVKVLEHANLCISISEGSCTGRLQVVQLLCKVKAVLSVLHVQENGGEVKGQTDNRHPVPPHGKVFRDRSIQHVKELQECEANHHDEVAATHTTQVCEEAEVHIVKLQGFDKDGVVDSG